MLRFHCTMAFDNPRELELVLVASDVILLMRMTDCRIIWSSSSIVSATVFYIVAWSKRFTFNRLSFFSFHSRDIKKSFQREKNLRLEFIPKRLNFSSHRPFNAWLGRINWKTFEEFQGQTIRGSLLARNKSSTLKAISENIWRNKGTSRAVQISLLAICANEKTKRSRWTFSEAKESPFKKRISLRELPLLCRHEEIWDEISVTSVNKYWTWRHIKQYLSAWIFPFHVATTILSTLIPSNTPQEKDLNTSTERFSWWVDEHQFSLDNYWK